MIRYFWCLSLIFIIACSSKEEKSSTRERQAKAISDSLDTRFPQRRLPSSFKFELNTPRDVFYLKSAQLHGSFFENKIEFYTIEEPSIRLFDTRIKKVTLYFIDGYLTKTKYLLEKDISSALINVHGKFNMVPLDTLTKNSVEDKKILRKVNKLYELHGNVQQYQLKWKKENKTLRYRKIRDLTLENESVMEYIEELNDYLPQFRMLEATKRI